MGRNYIATCQMKVHYPNKHAARQAALAMGGRDSRVRYDSFHCRFCGGWVIGRREWGR